MKNTLSKIKRKIPLNEHENIMRYYHAGIPTVIIANHYGVSRQAISRYFFGGRRKPDNINAIRNSIRHIEKTLKFLNREERLRGKSKKKRMQILKLRARKKTTTAILSGRLSRQPCQICGIAIDQHGRQVEAHHLDYNRPYNVMWLCKRHHRDWHMQYKAKPPDLGVIPSLN